MNKIKEILIAIGFIISLISCQTNQEIKFALVTDTHIGREFSEVDLRETVADINKRDDIDFVVVTGDVSDFGYDSELTEAKVILEELNQNWYVIPGNHDLKWTESGGTGFKKVMGYDRFVFEYKGYTFVGCGSGPEMRMGPAMVTSEDLMWMDSVFTKVKSPIIYFNHYPLKAQLSNNYKVIDLLKKGNTQAVFGGHFHNNHAFEYAGIPGFLGIGNTRGKREGGAYSIVTIREDSLFVEERIPAADQTRQWSQVELADHRNDQNQLEQPSFEMNKKYPQVSELWTIQDQSDIASQMIAVDKLCIYTNTAGKVRALDLQDGKLVWEFKTGNKIFSTPAYADGKVVVSSTDGSIYCLDSTSGELQWEFKTPKALIATPVLENDTVFIGSSEGKFRAISLANGALLWENEQISGFVETKPLLDESRIYFGAWGAGFYALSKSDGQIVWTWENKRTRYYSPAACVPVLAHGKVFVADPGKFVMALKPETGEELWRSDLAKGRESIAVSEDLSRLYLKSVEDSLVAISAAADCYQSVWSVDCRYGNSINPTPVEEKEGMVYAVCDNGCVYAVDAEARELSWAWKVAGVPLSCSLALGNDQLLVASRDGKISYLKFHRNLASNRH